MTKQILDYKIKDFKVSQNNFVLLLISSNSSKSMVIRYYILFVLENILVSLVKSVYF